MALKAMRFIHRQENGLVFVWDDRPERSFRDVTLHDTYGTESTLGVHVVPSACCKDGVFISVGVTNLPSNGGRGESFRAYGSIIGMRRFRDQLSAAIEKAESLAHKS